MQELLLFLLTFVFVFILYQIFIVRKAKKKGKKFKEPIEITYLVNRYKLDLKKYLRDEYEKFIIKYVDKEDYLYTISYAYALFAKKEPNIFFSMFMADLAGSRTVREVINTNRNMETIKAMTTQYNISLEDAEKVYRDVRFYTHGMATQLCVQSIKLSEEEIKKLISNNIYINLKGV